MTEFSSKMIKLSKELHDEYVRVAYHLTELYMLFETERHKEFSRSTQ